MQLSYILLYVFFCKEKKMREFEFAKWLWVVDLVSNGFAFFRNFQMMHFMNIIADSLTNDNNLVDL